MKKYAGIIGAVITGILGALVGEGIEQAAAGPWWISQVTAAIGAFAGFIAGGTIARKYGS